MLFYVRTIAKQQYTVNGATDIIDWSFNIFLIVAFGNFQLEGDEPICAFWDFNM